MWALLKHRYLGLLFRLFFSSPELKAHGELIVWYSSRRSHGGVGAHAHVVLLPVFMPPTLKKLEGHIAFGLSVCLCVCLSVC